MSYLVVCPLTEIETVAKQHQPQHMISLVEPSTCVPRPPTIPQDRHLFLGMNDIAVSQTGLTVPEEKHVKALLSFAQDWYQTAEKHPLLIHCWMGISRSTAAAFIIACACAPYRLEQEIAAELRFAAPFATPNARLIAIGDALLARQGRMVEAIRQIGRGAFAATGYPFTLNIQSV